MAKRRKKTRTHLKGQAGANAEGGGAGAQPGAGSAPKSFVMRSGNVGRNVASLVQDVRRTMEPNTASRLRERKSNKLRDFLTMCGPLGVSHLIMFGQKQKASRSGGQSLGNVNLRVARTPRGPTVTFRVNKFALASDVAKAQRRARAPGGEFQTAPLLVLNNFGSAEKHVKLLVSVFQGLFPPIQVQTMHLSSARRIVLLNYHEETGTIDWRHYLISVRPVGVSRRVRKVVEGSSASARSSKLARSLPDLGKAGDIADYLLGNANGTDGDGFETDASSASEAESDVEDGPGGSSKVTLPSRYVGRGNASGQQRAVRLRELGPRMELRCVKIEEGIPGAAKAGGSGGGNEVLWHDYVQKSGKEGQRLRKEALEREKQRKQRREEQEENVRRKKEASGKGKAKAAGLGEDGEEDEEEAERQQDEQDDEDEDEFAYEDAHGAGVAPDGDLFDDDDDDDDVDDAFDDEASMDEGDVGDEDDEEDDSDLTPFEIDEDEDDDEEASEEEEQAPPRKKSNRR